jgi:hypothetical protein
MCSFVFVSAFDSRLNRLLGQWSVTLSIQLRESGFDRVGANVSMNTNVPNVRCWSVIDVSRWLWLHLQSSIPTNTHSARVVGYGPSPYVKSIRKACAYSNGDIIRLMMIIIHTYIPLTLYPRRGSRGISNIPPRHPRFTKIS